MKDLTEIPTPPPRHAKSFRTVGRWLLFAVAVLTPIFFGKFAIIGFLTIAAFICFLGCVLEERRMDYPRSFLGLILLLFLVAQGISTWFSIAPTKSFFGDLTAPDSLMSFIIYFLLFFLFSFFFRREDVPTVGGAIGIGLLIATVFGFLQIGSLPGWGILMVALIVALVVIRPGQLSGLAKIYFFTALTVACAALIFISSQSLWLVLAIAIMAVALLRFEPREHFQYAFVIITIALFFALVSSRLPITPKIAANASPNISASLAATRTALKGPEILTGTGPATFALDYTTFPSPSPQGHDFVVTLLGTGGIMSILLFLCLVIFAIQPFLHMHSLETDLAMLASASTFLLAALFLYPASFATVALLFILLGMLQGATVRHKVSFDTAAPWKSFAFSIAIVVFAAAGLAGAFVLGEKYAATIFFGQSNSLAAAGDLGNAFKKINTAIALDPSDQYYRAASGILISEAKALAASGDPTATTELSSVITSAVQAAENAVAANSHDPANWGNLGSTYEAIVPIVDGADTSAVNGYQQAAALDPLNPQWDVDTARVLMESASLLAAGPANDPARATDFSAAEGYLQQAITIKDDYADPRVLLVQLYLQEGDIAQAIQKVQELKQQNPLDSGVAFELGYLYYQSNQLDQAQEEFQVATILDPKYANARYFLGLIYDQKGMTSQALDQFRAVQTLNPDNQQIATIIANVEAGQPALTNLSGQPTLSGTQQPTQVVASSTPSSPVKKGK